MPQGGLGELAEALGFAPGEALGKVGSREGERVRQSALPGDQGGHHQVERVAPALIGQALAIPRGRGDPEQRERGFEDSGAVREIIDGGDALGLGGIDEALELLKPAGFAVGLALQQQDAELVAVRSMGEELEPGSDGADGGGGVVDDDHRVVLPMALGEVFVIAQEAGVPARKAVHKFEGETGFAGPGWPGEDAYGEGAGRGEPGVEFGEVLVPPDDGDGTVFGAQDFEFALWGVLLGLRHGDVELVNPEEGLLARAKLPLSGD